MAGRPSNLDQIMENPTLFDLNRAIQQWRESLGASPAFQRENLEELEAHLRDSMAALASRGLSMEEAFWVATRRIGTGDALAPEFGKVNRQTVWLDRLFWMLIGLQVWGFISGSIVALSRDALLLGLNGVGYNPKIHGQSVLVVLYTLVQLAGFAGSLFLCWWLFCRQGQHFGRWLAPRLQRRGGRVVLFGALYLLSLSVPLLNGGMQTLMTNTLGREKIMQFYGSLGIFSIITYLITPAILTWFTLSLARKRQRQA